MANAFGHKADVIGADKGRYLKIPNGSGEGYVGFESSGMNGILDEVVCGEFIAGNGQGLVDDVFPIEVFSLGQRVAFGENGGKF